MNRKISLGLALSLIIMTMAASFAVTMVYSQRIYNKIIPGLSDRLERIYELEEIEGYVSNEYFAFNDIDWQALNASVAEGYLDGLNTGLDRYLTAEKYKEYLDKIEGKAHGIGVITANKPGSGALYVTFVAPGSSAAKDGIKAGDEIVKIDDEAVTFENREQMAAKLQGMSLKSVKLACKRGSTNFTVEALYGFDMQSVAYSVYETLGYIKITGFYKTTPAQLENAIEKLTDQGVKGIVFDVRGTNDGTIEYAARTTDVVVPLTTEKNASLAKAVDRNGATLVAYPADVKELTLPMTVLIDEKTSGGAELFAVSLVDFKDVITVGANTAGNNTMQKPCPLRSGGAILLTVAEVQPYKTATYKDGIVPKIPVTLTAEQAAAIGTLALKDDPQFLQAAANMPGG